MLTLLPGCSAMGIGGQKVTIGGAELVQIEESLQDAERVMFAAAAQEPANLTPDARCYLILEGEPAEPAERIRCGPILFADSDASSPWILLRTSQRRPTDGSDGVRFHVGEMISRSAPLDVTERLWRPDEVPAPTSIELAVPLPPPLPRDFMESYFAGRTDLLVSTGLLQRPKDPELRSESGVVRINGVASIDAPAVIEGRTVRPPDGHVLHLVQVDISDLRAQQQLALRVAGRSVKDIVQDGGTAFVAPLGARIDLYLRDRLGIEHIYDLADGSITLSPEIYYRNTRGTVQFADSIAPRITCPDRSFTLDSFPLRMTVSGFSLQTFRLPTDTRRPANHGRLGVGLRALSEEDAERLDVTQDTGLRVGFTVPESAADRAGIVVDDIIVRVEGRPVLPDGSVIGETLRGRAVGDVVQVEIIRNGQPLNIAVTLTQWVWLVMDYEVTGALDWSVPLPASRWLLNLPGGALLAAVPADISDPFNPFNPGWQRSTFGAEQPAWQVPAGFTSGRITIAPGSHAKFGCNVNFGDRSFDIPVNIPLR